MKSIDDGSYEIRYALLKNRIEPISFVLCGVNLDACVNDTYWGLVGKYPDTPVMIHIDACAMSGENERFTDIHERQKFVKNKGMQQFRLQ